MKGFKLVGVPKEKKARRMGEASKLSVGGGAIDTVDVPNPAPL